MPILVIGGSTVDIIFPAVSRLPVWPNHTEFTATNLALLGEPPLVTIGGNGANAAYVAARCGAAVTLSSNPGRDAFGVLVRAWLEEAGCHVSSSVGATRTAVNVTAANARLRRATLFYPGSPPRLPARTGGAGYVLVCGWPHPPARALAKQLRVWQKAGVRTAYDAGPILEAAPALAELKPVLAALDLFLANEHEACTLTRTTRLDAAWPILRQACPGHIIIKRGPRGALWLPPQATKPIVSRGRRIRAVNTVGAGDTFNGALLAALDLGCDFPAALRRAHTAAASVVRSGRGVLGLVP